MPVADPAAEGALLRRRPPLHLLLLLLLLLGCGESLDVLVLHPLHGASHEAQLRTLAGELLARGHHVTTVRFQAARDAKVPPVRRPDNLTLITLTIPNEDGSVPFVTRGRRGKFQLPLERLWRSGLCPFQVPLSAFRTNDALCSALLPPGGRLRRRLGTRRFHVALVDALANECGFALAHALEAPAVAYWALPLSGGEADYLAGLWRPAPLAHGPGILTGLSDHMNYLQRVQNAFFRAMSHLVMQIQFWYTHAAIQRHLPGTPDPRTLLEDVAGVLENSDVALDYPRALPPNVINVGCMQCRPPRPLPRDLEEFVEGSGGAGVVVFSMGATIDAAVAPRAFLRRLLRAFGRLPQRVLMKFDGPVDGEEVPANVRILPWLPQQDLLGHRRARVFFAHCGLHGAMEAVYHGVPVVGMPVYGDQKDVATMLEASGVGVSISKGAHEDEIHRVLSEVIGDPRYKRNALRRRDILRDAPQTAMERAVWFVEYAARHHGAPHLRLATRHHSAAQLLGLDVLSILLLPPALLLFLHARSSIRRRTSGGAPPDAAAHPRGRLPLLAAAVAQSGKFLRAAILFVLAPSATSRPERAPDPGEGDGVDESPRRSLESAELTDG
ncbi:UDP-glucuronosyltransferase 2C1-like [Hetaerina americana]|uniref:UDP-glucuronosyltransferase 2C1-like n=1 Tax=Hetaerina americana TaxID=62018 RepID=UPI003A7F560C